MQLLKDPALPWASGSLDQSDLIRAIQRKVAVSSVPASAMRGQGVKGVVSAARNYLTSLTVAKFATTQEAAFQMALNEETIGLRAELPRGARKWGLARKVMNLFLRDAFYNRFLSENSALDVAQSLYELPMDSIVAEALRKERGSEDLPSWPGLKYLTPSENEAYQAFANQIAVKRGILRVHLDAYYWAAERPSPL